MVHARGDFRERLPPALPDDPPIGVHVLTEFLYCPRAGVIAWETAAHDIGDEEPPPRLDYLPRFDVRLMHEELERRLNRFWVYSALCLFGVATFALAAYFRSSWGLLSGIFGTLAAGYFAGKEFYSAVLLILLIRRVENTLPLEPSSPLTEVEPIDWWELLAAGFVSKRYDEDEVLNDPELRLAGRPWRILARGDLRIPVFLQRRPTDRLYPQHFARISAYCHLVELATGFDAPYGIVLHAGRYSGWAVPNSLHAMSELQRGLELARTTISALRRQHRIPPNPSTTLCWNCPFARPRRFRQSFMERIFGKRPAMVPYVFQLRERNYHSVCGDRFRWVPPHRDIARLDGGSQVR